MTNLPATTSDDWSHQDRVFVALYIEMGRVVPAAQQAYQLADPVKAGRMGNAFLKVNRNVLDLVLEREGLTDQALAKTIVEGLSANKVTYAKYQGKIGESRKDTDHTNRLSAAKLGLELKGHINKHKQQLDEGSGSTGPVILPVRPGMELPPTAVILEGEFEQGGDRQEEVGGSLLSEHTNPPPTPSSEDSGKTDLESGKKLDVGENENEDDW